MCCAVSALDKAHIHYLSRLEDELLLQQSFIKSRNSLLPNPLFFNHSKKLRMGVGNRHLVPAGKSKKTLEAVVSYYLELPLIVAEVIIRPQHHHFDYHDHIILLGASIALCVVVHHCLIQPTAVHLKVYHAVKFIKRVAYLGKLLYRVLCIEQSFGSEEFVTNHNRICRDITYKAYI